MSKPSQISWDSTAVENHANSVGLEFRDVETLANIVGLEFRGLENLAKFRGVETWEISRGSNVNAMQWKCIEVQCTESRTI